MINCHIVACVQLVTPRFAELRPIFQLTEPDEWEFIANANDEFPDRGLVIWFQPPENAALGSFWNIEIEPCATYDGASKREKFLVKPESAHEIFEVVDLRQFGAPELIREQLVGSGLPIPNRNISTAILRIDESDFVGPVRLVTHQGHYRLSDDQDRTCMRYHKLSELDLVILDAPMNGRILIRDSNRLNAFSRIETWESDVEILRKIAPRLRKLDQRIFDELEITYRVFNAYVDAVEKAQLTPEVREIERSRARRLSSIKENIEFDLQLSQDAAAFLKKQPSVEKELQQSLEAEKDRIRKELDNELQDAKLHLASLREDTDTLQKEHDAKAAEIARQVGHLEDSIQDRLSAAIEQPAECLADIAIFNAVFQQIGTLGSKTQSIEAENSTSGSPGIVVSTDEQLDDLITNNLEALDADHAIKKKLHAAFLSGQIPVLMGTRAIAALKAYDHSVGNGTAMWCPISAHAVSTADILQTDELACWLEQAHSTDLMRLLILDGANNAGAESALTPLASCYSESWSNSTLRRLLFQIGQELRRLAWPRNILLAAIANEGATTLPLPSEFWYHAMPVGCNPKQRHFGSDGLHPFARDAELSTGQVHLATWAKWRSQVVGQSCQPIESVVDKFEVKHPLSRETRDQTLCYFSALRSQGVDEKNSIELATFSCILPHLYQDETSLRELLVEIGFGEEYVDGAVDGCKALSEFYMK